LTSFLLACICQRATPLEAGTSYHWLFITCTGKFWANPK